MEKKNHISRLFLLGTLCTTYHCNCSKTQNKYLHPSISKWRTTTFLDTKSSKVVVPLLLDTVIAKDMDNHDLKYTLSINTRKTYTKSLAVKFVILAHPIRWLHCTLLSGHWRWFNGTEEDRLRDLNTCQQKTVYTTHRPLLFPSIPSSSACCSNSWSLWWYYGISSGTLQINTRNMWNKNQPQTQNVCQSW